MLTNTASPINQCVTVAEVLKALKAIVANAARERSIHSESTIMRNGSPPMCTTGVA
jgi:uncharacterized protein (DUF362 family)